MATEPAKRDGKRRKRNENGFPTGQVQSLTRGLILLERITESHGISLTNLAQQVGLPNSTTHRLLSTMEHMGFVQQVRDRGLWTIGVRAFTVGSAFLDSRDVMLIAHPIMRRLMEQCGETANLSVLDVDAGEAVVIGQVQCRELMRMLSAIGSRMPLHASGAGKAFLATMDDAQLSQVVHKAGLQRYTENTIDSLARLRHEVHRIREQGYSVSNEEHASGLRCVAACVYNEYQAPFASISVSGPKSRISDDRVADIGSLVMQAAQDLTLAYSGRLKADDGAGNGGGILSRGLRGLHGIENEDQEPLVSVP